MEDNGEYKAICSLIDNIERNLTQVQNVQNEQNFEFIRREIEEHFERCVHALEARCQQLIDELTQIFVQEAPVDNLLAIYNKCIEIKELGIGVFKIQENIAELTWKEAQKIVLPSTNTESIEVDFSLPKVILSTISVHGTVTLKNPGSKISTTSCYSNTNSTEKLLEHIAQIQDNVIVLQTFANNFQTLQESEESKNKMMATMETTLQLVKIVLQLVKDVVPTSDTDEYKEIYKELDNKKAEIAELKVAHATEHAALQKVIDMQCEKIDSAATQISQLQREKQQLAELIDKFNLEKMREGIESNAKTMVDALKHELVISNLEKDIIRLKMEADRIQQAHELEEKQWKRTEAELKENLSRVDTELKQHQALRAKFEGEFFGLKEKSSTATQETYFLKEVNAQLQNNIQRFEAELAEKKQLAESLAQEINTTKKAHKALQLENQRLNDKINSMEQMIQGMDKKKNKLKEYEEAIDKKLEVKKAKIAELTKELAAVQKIVNEQREKISGLLAQQAENNTAHNKENLNS